jgi:ABC-type lipoprotein export system ATPase subunit
MSDDVLRATGLVRRLGGREIVSSIDMVIARGELVALMGPSGCGKTTLLQLLGVLDRPDAGTVAIDGSDPWQSSEAVRARLRREQVGFVFQQNNLLGHLSARDNVTLPAWRASGSRKTATVAADRLLEQVGLASLAGATARDLSIGEAQRVAIARALVNRPKIILADEPTGSLDAESADRVMELLFAPGDTAVLVVTHDPDVASRASRRLSMRNGKLLS